MPESSQVQALLDEVREALVRRGQQVAAGADPRELDVTLEALYRALGQAMAASSELDEITDGVFTDPENSSLQTMSHRVLPSLPPSALGPSDEWSLSEVDARLEQLEELGYLVDDSTPVVPPQREYTDTATPDPPEFAVATLAAFEARGLCPSQESHEMGSLLELLVPPASFSDADELAVEASRIQWATLQLADRLSAQPSEIQTGMVAMLAARAQHLRLRLDDDLGPRLTLAKLQRFRLEHRLPVVAGLMPTPRPESGSWEQDARRWWAYLGAVGAGG
jgi:hypothetical protein